jgi:hypothetical protein
MRFRWRIWRLKADGRRVLHALDVQHYAAPLIGINSRDVADP